MKKDELVESMEKNAVLMEKINIQIKNSPVLIYKKQQKEKEKKVVAKEIPTMKVDFMTAMKEPEKVKHIKYSENEDKIVASRL